MGGKPVFLVPAKSIINFDSAFSHKLLCDGPTFSTGSSCQFSCSFCYVPDLMRKSNHVAGLGETKFEDAVIRREGAVQALRSALLSAKGRREGAQKKVIYASPLVDVAANMDLVRETVECCEAILEMTCWDIRLLSKSNLLPKIAEALGEKAKARVIYGVSTGTLDDGLAKAFEQGTPLVSKRIASLHWLQDNGYRTFGMVCPSLPQEDYEAFANGMYKALRGERCEHYWAEVINSRGVSFDRTYAALREGSFNHEAQMFKRVSMDRVHWEMYARRTFLAHAAVLSPGKLRFLQYVTPDTKPWWKDHEPLGAVLLGAWV
jgi:DNA repair photolyase